MRKIEIEKLAVVQTPRSKVPKLPNVCDYSAHSVLLCSPPGDDQSAALQDISDACETDGHVAHATLVQKKSDVCCVPATNRNALQHDCDREPTKISSGNLEVHKAKCNAKERMATHWPLLCDDQQRERQWRLGEYFFNKHPRHGPVYLIQAGLFADTPADISQWLLSGRQHRISRSAIGEYLGYPGESNQSVLAAFIERVVKPNQNVELALRQFLSHFRLPGEAQQINRVLSQFSQHYYHLAAQSPPCVFRNADSVHMVVYSCIILNTDAHNRSIRHKMAKADFVTNLRSVTDGDALPAVYLEGLYDSIVARPFVPPPDHVDDVRAVQATLHGLASCLARPYRYLVAQGIFEGLGTSQPTKLFLFNDTLLACNRRSGRWIVKWTQPLWKLEASLVSDTATGTDAFQLVHLDNDQSLGMYVAWERKWPFVSHGSSLALEHGAAGGQGDSRKASPRENRGHSTQAQNVTFITAVDAFFKLLVDCIDEATELSSDSIHSLHMPTICGDIPPSVSPSGWTRKRRPLSAVLPVPLGRPAMFTAGSFPSPGFLSPFHRTRQESTPRGRMASCSAPVAPHWPKTVGASGDVNSSAAEPEQSAENHTGKQAVMGTEKSHVRSFKHDFQGRSCVPQSEGDGATQGAHGTVIASHPRPAGECAAVQHRNATERRRLSLCERLLARFVGRKGVHVSATAT